MLCSGDVAAQTSVTVRAKPAKNIAACPAVLPAPIR